MEGVGVSRWREVLSSPVEETIGISSASARVPTTPELLGAAGGYTDCLRFGVGRIGGPCFRKLRIKYVTW